MGKSSATWSLKWGVKNAYIFEHFNNLKKKLNKLNIYKYQDKNVGLLLLLTAIILKCVILRVLNRKYLN